MGGTREEHAWYVQKFKGLLLFRTFIVRTFNVRTFYVRTFYVRTFSLMTLYIRTYFVEPMFTWKVGSLSKKGRFSGLK